MTTRTVPNTDLVTIDVDTEGTQLGQFNDGGDPMISYDHLTDVWMLAYKISTGTACVVLDNVHGSHQEAIAEAVTSARKYLATN